MVSANNLKELNKRDASKQQHFTIKKLSVGVASVLLGISFAASTSASADSLPNSSNENENIKQNPDVNDYSNSINIAHNSQLDNNQTTIDNSKFNNNLASNKYEEAVEGAIKHSNTANYINPTNNEESQTASGSNTSYSDSLAIDKYQTVSDANSLVNVANSGAGGVNVKGTITFDQPLNLNHRFVINGLDGATLNLGNNPINNNGDLILSNITINGSILGNGTVSINGHVISNVDANNSVKLTNNELSSQIGNIWNGANTENWKSANISASKVNVQEDSSLDINRSIVGDGVSLLGGTARYLDNGATFGTTEATNDLGKLKIDTNGKLNINLKDAGLETRYNEKASSLENASVGIRAQNGNGHIETGDSSQLTINAGHGRGIVFGEKFGGTAPIHNVIFDDWQTPRVGNHESNYTNYQTNSNVILGDSNQVSITGREGILLGDRALFNTGNHSTIKIVNHGNGSGLVLGNFSKVTVSPHSELLMSSDGKDCTGSYNNGNYIGLGDDGKFNVEHDATFKYVLINRGNGTARPWDDNMNIISQSSTAHPEVYVGNNATFDGESDYAQFNGEIFSFALNDGRTPTAFQIDGAKYVNLERNANTQDGAGPVGGQLGQGNLYYSMGPGLIDASGKSYYVFKWNNGNLNDNNQSFDSSTSKATKNSILGFINSSDKYWKGITNLATQYSKSGNTSEFPGHNVSGSDIVGVNTVDLKNGTPANKFSDTKSDNTGFDPKNSQRLVLVATEIPTQEDKTKQDVTPYKVKIKKNNNLKPGEVKLIQKGKNGLSRVTQTVYYIVDATTGNKILDTSKGNGGYSITNKLINEPQDEIIEVGPQTATIKYYYQDSNNNISPIVNNQEQLQTAISNIPFLVDNTGNIIFDNKGNVIPQTIQYDDSQDINSGKNIVNKITGVGLNNISIVENTWEVAKNNGTNKYNVSGINRNNIISTAEKAGENNIASLLPDNGPIYNVVLGVTNSSKEKNAQNIPASQTIKFVDENGNTLRENNVQTSQFTRTPDVVDAVTGKTITEGSWNETSHQFGTINVPVIDGYVATVKTAGGLTATTDNPNVETEVVYKKVGKIIPVDPSGNPIPNVPTPSYPNDPQDPTKVTPNEPVPDVPGYVPTTPTVTPEVPTEDTPVVYNQVQKADLTIIDQDNGNKQIIVPGVTTKFITEGTENGTISFKGNEAAVKSLENMGYEYVDSDFTNGTKFDDDSATDQHFTITMKHGMQPVNPDQPGKPGQPINPNDPNGPKYPQGSDQVSKNVTRTVQYVDESGNKLNDPIEQSVDFIAEGVLDKVTGQWKAPLTWSGSQTVNGVKTPVVDGYHVVNVDRDADGNNVKGVTLTHENDSYTVTVSYAKNGKIVPVDPSGKPIPNVPTPQYPTDPENPAKVTPNEPVPDIPGFVPEVPTVTPTNPGEDTPVIYRQLTNNTSNNDSVQNKTEVLPQTGNKDINSEQIFGLATLSLAGLLAVGQKKSKKEF